MAEVSRNVIYTLGLDQAYGADGFAPFTHVIAGFLMFDVNEQQQLVVNGSPEFTNFTGTSGLISSLRQMGIKVMFSVGGQTATTSGWQAAAADVNAAAKALVDYAEHWQLDGFDIDWEDYINGPQYDCVAFLSGISSALKALRPAYLVSHAPQAPYLYPGWSDFKDGLYQGVMAKAGNNIDWLNIQYYNNPWYVGQGAAEQQQKVAGFSGTPVFPSSIVGLVDGSGNPEGYKLPPEKLVLGHPTTQANDEVSPQQQDTAYLPAQTVADDLVTPLVSKYGTSFGGVMGWQYWAAYSSDQAETAWGDTMAKALGLKVPA
ncbi:glycosyl hydrolase family 18 protein [Roseibium sp. RKSG952]|uniref:glycosyl hydrolase family 18 protein n=1 Tax=Roseibium sp. RKSG952 TaxID=2529384 RepID=UPI0012BCD820|nr:glycosyl hydrolase family 18 protein [Roseibium sp. RKSG952]MTI00564.1 chitinase [Roseibium sp. RKSG952]